MEIAEVQGAANFNISNGSTGNEGQDVYRTVEIVLISTVAGSLSLVTVVGNILVMLSIHVNRQLKTVNNYFLFSLACADFFIGVFSMNLYTVYIIKRSWTLGAVVCDLWLALDYVVSNASVMNLLIISFDRYFCVTKPLSYPARRTTKTAGLMIAAAWILSFILWAPAILFWQFIVGKRTVLEDQCHIQFLSNPFVTFGTAIAAFYLPVVIMTVLYVHISLASRSRIRRRNKEKCRETTFHNGFLSKWRLLRRGCASSSGVPKIPKVVSLKNGDVECKDNVKVKGQREEKISNESTSLSLMASNPKEDQTTEGQADSNECKNRVGNADGSNRQQFSLTKQSKVKIVTKVDCRDGCITAVEVVPDYQSQTPQQDKPNSVARKFANIARNQVQKRRKVAAREKKVTRTIFAILLVFIITWTPYNVMVLINIFCSKCIPDTMWRIGYWLCYINSTINPACYALCNATFKKTFKHLLLCQYKKIGHIR
uniref:muscarinic acetylcholine receptor M4 n=1 Tax=Myxine glutinosa TaxID=7769 RepID=UPI00358E87E9